MASEKSSQKINGFDLLNWFQSGAMEVGTQKKYLNSINVFPIADGDTGTNLFTTLRAMVDNSVRIQSFASMIRNISESGLAYARGNSGIIFASYVNGLAINGASYEAVGLKEFSQIAHKAVDHLYQSIENPTEGTMISVIRDWASFQAQNHERFETFQELLTAAYHHAIESLNRTTTQLEILSKHRVVDSGAAGFVRFLDGINRVLSGGNKVQEHEPSLIPMEPLEIQVEESQTHTYCTEVYLEFTGLDIAIRPEERNAELKKLLQPYGDSLIVSTVGRRTRVHIHTDHPASVVHALKPYGTLLEQKADNMSIQNSVRSQRKHPIGILTDSIADLPEEWKVQEQIHTLPLGLLMEDTVYLDKTTITLEQLFPAIEKAENYPTSSQPEPARIRAMLESLMEVYDSLIVIAVSSNLSGTYQAIQQEAKKIQVEGKPITVIDSKLNSGAQGLMVKMAADFRKEGYSHSEIVERILGLIPQTKIYVCLDTIEYAVRGGRVSNTVGAIGMKLGLRPIMTLDGTGQGATFGMAFSRKGITKKILHLIEKTQKRDGIASYSIVHANNPELAEEYRLKLRDITGLEPAFLSEISSIVAINSGPGSIAVCFTKR